MGDRANCVVRQRDEEPGEVWLYTHWRGSELLHLVQQALKKKWRWSDPAYLTRIIFDVMTDGAKEETGFGISCSGDLCDNEHNLIVVDVPREEVRIENYSHRIDPDSPEYRKALWRFGFQEFCDLNLNTFEGYR